MLGQTKRYGELDVRYVVRVKTNDERGVDVSKIQDTQERCLGEEVVEGVESRLVEVVKLK